jgi:pimeloyl-ACP methyl ester carboxylesterase
MKSVVVCFVAWAWVAGVALADAPYQVISAGVDHPSADLTRTELSVQAGDDPLDRFDIVRIQRSDPAHVADPPLILLAPFSFPAEFWELTVSGDYEDAFGPQIALAGYDVWLVDSRVSDVAPGQCESGAVDCSAMAGWDQETAIADAMFTRKLVRFAHPQQKPVIGGFSGGSSTAMATVDRHPRAFAGLFMWEGTLYTANPAIRTRNAGFCAQDEALLDAGVFFDPAVQGFKVLFQLAAAAPNDPSPIPVFPPGTTNLQALLFAFTMPDPNNPLNFTADFIRLVGDPFAATLTYSDLDRVLIWGPLVGNYAPIAFIRDTHCSIGGLETRFTDRLDRFRGKALIYAEGLGFGQMMLDTAALMTRADVTIDFHPELAESDRYFHQDWQTVALDPLLAWLEQVF